MLGERMVGVDGDSESVSIKQSLGERWLPIILLETIGEWGCVGE